MSLNLLGNFSLNGVIITFSLIRLSVNVTENLPFALVLASLNLKRVFWMQSNKSIISGLFQYNVALTPCSHPTYDVSVIDHSKQFTIWRFLLHSAIGFLICIIRIHKSTELSTRSVCLMVTSSTVDNHSCSFSVRVERSHTKVAQNLWNSTWKNSN